MWKLSPRSTQYTPLHSLKSGMEKSVEKNGPVKQLYNLNNTFFSKQLPKKYKILRSLILVCFFDFCWDVAECSRIFCVCGISFWYSREQARQKFAKFAQRNATFAKFANALGDIDGRKRVARSKASSRSIRWDLVFRVSSCGGLGVRNPGAVQVWTIIEVSIF